MTNEQVEEFAREGWNAFYAKTNDPLWDEFAGPEKQNQISLARSVALNGASPEHPLEMAYEAAYEKWLTKQPVPHEDEPPKAPKTPKSIVPPLVEQKPARVEPNPSKREK